MFRYDKNKNLFYVSLNKFSLTWVKIDTIHSVVSFSSNKKWGVWCQKQVSQAGISNCIPQNAVVCNYLSMPEMSGSGTKYSNSMPNWYPVQWCYEYTVSQGISRHYIDPLQLTIRGCCWIEIQHSITFRREQNGCHFTDTSEMHILHWWSMIFR